MTSQLDKPVKLTYTQLINLLCILFVRVENIEKLLTDLLEELDKQGEFQNFQILKTRSDMMRYNNKTPSRRLNDLEEQFKGLVAFVNDKREKRNTEWS